MAKNFRKLTRPAMRKLSVGQKLIEHGVEFERAADGDGIFRVNIMVDGERIHRVVGRESDGTTRTQAESYIEKVRQDAKEERLCLPKGRKLALSFKDAGEKYIEKLGQEGGKDISAKKRRLEQHLTPFLSGKPLSKISSFDIERYKKFRVESKPPVKPSTVNRELAVLSHLFSKAIDWGWIKHRPAKINHFKEENHKITYLTVEQCKRLVDVAKHDQSPQVYPFIVIGLGTAMRKTEILSIKREHIDLDRRMISIPKAKAGAREQPITSELAAFLKGYLDILEPGCEWLFPSIAAKEGHTVDIRKPFRRVVKEAGLDPDKIVRHTLRHTAITHLVQAGVDLPTVKRISGHKTLSMIERYAHQNGEHIQAAMDKLNDRYRGIS